MTGTKRKPEPYAPSILIVDDDEQIRRLFRRLLVELGYFVSDAASGRQALSAVRGSFFDLMILDLSLPDQDGMEVIRAVKKEVPDLKVLVVSGFMHGSMLQAARQVGAHSTMDKMRAVQLLVPTVCRVLAS